MDLIIQVLMGVSLAACAGLRAWLPLLLTGLLGRTGWVDLNNSFDILSQTGTLIALSVATVLEILGDKIVVVDNLLDQISTLVRPAAGTVLAASLLTNLDPAMSLMLGLITGGGAALTVHAGKSALRAGTTAMAPAHGGAGNAALSFVEDVFAFVGTWGAIFVPVLAFAFTLFAFWLVYRIIVRTRARGSRLLRWLWTRNR